MAYIFDGGCVRNVSRIIRPEMKETFIHFAEEHLYLHIILITLAAGTIIVSMGIDMFSGINKAKKIGQEITSRKMGGTFTKAWDYFAPFTCLTLLDLLASIILPFPFFSLVCAGVCVYREFKSIREKSWQKQQIHDFDRTIKIAASDKADIAKILASIVGEGKDTPTDPPPMTEADIVKLVTDIMRKANEAQEAPEADNATV